MFPTKKDLHYLISMNMNAVDTRLNFYQTRMTEKMINKNRLFTFSNTQRQPLFTKKDCEINLATNCFLNQSTFSEITF